MKGLYYSLMWDYSFEQQGIFGCIAIVNPISKQENVFCNCKMWLPCNHDSDKCCLLMWVGGLL
jgi:hypothetical protein